MTPEEMNEVNRMIQTMDITSFDFVDQLAIAAATEEFLGKIGPIYIKYAAKSDEPTTFLFRMN